MGGVREGAKIVGLSKVGNGSKGCGVAIVGGSV